MDETQALAALSALSAPTRLRMVKCLVKAGGDGMTAGEIAQTTQATPSRASFHLAGLTRAGLVQSQRASREIVYTVKFEALGGLLGYLLHDCCQGHVAVARCCEPSEIS